MADVWILDISTYAHGTLFYGTLNDPVVFRGIVRDYADHLTNVLSDRAVADIRAYLPTQYMYLGHNGGDPKHNPIPKNPGFLQESVHSEIVTAEHHRVTTDPVVYGPWIEGISERNLVIFPGRLRRGLSGRFPGYHAFRKIAQDLDLAAEDIAQREFLPYLTELNA